MQMELESFICMNNIILVCLEKKEKEKNNIFFSYDIDNNFVFEHYMHTWHYLVK